MVRETKTLDELTEITRDAATSPEQLRALRRSVLSIANPDVTREIVARADADFERIFGSE